MHVQKGGGGRGSGGGQKSGKGNFLPNLRPIPVMRPIVVLLRFPLFCGNFGWCWEPQIHHLSFWGPKIVSSDTQNTTIRAKIFTCSFYFLGNCFFEMLAVTVTAFNFRGIDYSSIQFEQVKCTLSGSYTVTVLNFWGINVAMQAGIVTWPKFLGIINV